MSGAGMKSNGGNAGTASASGGRVTGSGGAATSAGSGGGSAVTGGAGGAADTGGTAGSTQGGSDSVVAGATGTGEAGAPSGTAGAGGSVGAAGAGNGGGGAGGDGDSCPPGEPTRLTGTVYDPSGLRPLSNVRVYVPKGALSAVAEGAACGQCAADAALPVEASTFTDASGHFVLENVPVGARFTLVMQIGKWRRAVSLPSLTPCAESHLDDPNLTRLPRNQSEGHLPRIALATGGTDALECLLRRVGVSDTEFTTEAGAGRIHLYAGRTGTNSFAPALGQANFPAVATLVSSSEKLKGYDAIFLSCEGSQYADGKQPYLANFKNYVDSGGRAFLNHLQFYWLRSGLPPLPDTAQYIGPGDLPPSPAASTVDVSFSKGQLFADWLKAVGATTTNQLDVYGAQHSVVSVTPPTRRWLYVPANANDSFDPKRPAVQLMSFDTPVGTPASQQCGRVAFADLHVKEKVTVGTGVTGGDDSDVAKPFPTGCAATPSSPQQLAAEFLLFEMFSCF